MLRVSVLTHICGADETEQKHYDGKKKHELPPSATELLRKAVDNSRANSFKNCKLTVKTKCEEHQKKQDRPQWRYWQFSYCFRENDKG